MASALAEYDNVKGGGGEELLFAEFRGTVKGPEHTEWKSKAVLNPGVLWQAILSKK